MRRIFRSVTSTLRHSAKRSIALALTLSAALGVCGQTVLAQNTFLISDSDRVSTVAEATETEETVSQIIINQSQVVTVDCDGELYVAAADGGTVQSVLDGLEITLAAGDICSVPLDTETYDGMCIEITRMTENIVYTESAIAYETEYYEDETLEVGETREVVAGVDGTMREAWQVTYEDGEIVSQTLVESTVVTEPTNRVVLTHTDRSIHEHDAVVVGDVTSSTISEEAASTLPENAIVTASGEVYTYSSVLTCTATAYTGGGTTASGTAARVGEVAVDPKVIPLGSILYIVSDDGYCIYGYCVAEDTGGLIKGKRVDLYMDTYTEAINFGCRSVTVYILDPA
jgi:3D (Asp-Asp-Asp) domain-containing protein